MALHPLPVQLNEAPSTTVERTKVETVSYRTEGLLHITDWGVVLEWNKTRTTQRVSMVGEVATDVEELPGETVEVPIDGIAEVRLIGGWWRRRRELEVRVKGLDFLRGVPGAQGVTLRLGFERRDRQPRSGLRNRDQRACRGRRLRPPDDPRRFGTAGPIPARRTPAPIRDPPAFVRSDRSPWPPSRRQRDPGHLLLILQHPSVRRNDPPRQRDIRIQRRCRPTRDRDHHRPILRTRPDHDPRARRRVPHQMSEQQLEGFLQPHPVAGHTGQPRARRA